jgi:4-amino-4-deoxy-L-arabinose transferase-like glycosyltransferase
MPTMAVREFLADRGLRRWGPEAVLAALASIVFLGFLGSVDLWGKREQRASAEAIDTIDHSHWLVAQIQGRPRLEKPPLPRWAIATLMTVAGRRDEWMVRLPSVLSALGMVGLVYLLGTRIGGRSVGLASGLTLTSMGFFISELRQAGNDGPLAFFTTLALYAAWCRLHGDGVIIGEGTPGARRWTIVMYGAVGLGFLTKGPVVILLVALTILPYLACARRLGRGLRLLADGWGAVLFLFLALSWPVPVLLADPNAARVWIIEMGQKAGTAGIGHHRWRPPLAADWPWMTLPWAVVATTALALPFVRSNEGYRPRIWFPWWWAVGSLLMFCLWSVAKPNYFLPCMPGVALLCGLEWVRLTRSARTLERSGIPARRMLQLHWIVLFVGAMLVPIVVHPRYPDLTLWSSAIALALALGVSGSAWAWRRGADAGALAPLVGALAVGVLIGYGVVAPRENGVRSHRSLAETLEQILPEDAHTVMFFHEIDEGLWFYLRDRSLEPVPGSQPKYNDAVGLVVDTNNNPDNWDPEKRADAQQKLLIEWISQPRRGSSYVLIRDLKYDRFAPALAGLVTPIHREHDMKRNELVLLKVNAVEPVATGPEETIRK